MGIRKLINGLLAFLALTSVGFAQESQEFRIKVDSYSTFDIKVKQEGSDNVIKIENSSVNGRLTLKGYGKNTKALTQSGKRNQLKIDKISSNKGATLGIKQNGNGNEIYFRSLVSKNGSINVNVSQSGDNNSVKTSSLGSVTAYGKISINIKQAGGNNKIMINKLDALNGNITANVTMANTDPNEENLIGGIDESQIKYIDPNSKSLDDVNKYLQFSYETGIYMKGNSVNLNAYINGTRNKVGIYQVAESGKAEAEVNIGKDTPSSYNTVLIYQKANPGTNAFARVNVEGNGRTVKVYQTGETYADVDVKSTYSGSAPIIIKQKNYAPDAPNDVKVTFK